MSRLVAFSLLVSACVASWLAVSQLGYAKVSDNVSGQLYGGSSNCALTLADQTWCGYECPLPGFSCDVYNPCCTINLVVKMGAGTKSTYSTKHCGDSMWCVSYPDYMTDCSGG